jgi:predicted MFS family arabinose efflux permease
MRSRILRTYPALENRDFRIFFIGQVISFGGTWLQNAAQLWLVFLVTHSAFAVGMTGFLLFVPTMVIAPFGGVIVDKIGTRKVLYVTQVLAIIQSVLFGIVILTGHATLPVINVLVFSLGLINAFDATGRHTLTMQIVGKELIPSAMALGETLMSVGVILGSSAAGILIATIGIASTFFVNAATFVPVIVSLHLISQPDEVPERRSERSLKMFSSGISYIVSDRKIRSLLALVGITIFFGFPYRTLMPVIAREIFRVGSVGFGWLCAAPGIGAFMGAMIFSRNVKRWPLTRFILFGYALMAIALIALSLTSNFAIGMMEIALAGAGLTFATAALPSLLRQLANKQMLGRVVGIDVAIFYGGLALGNFTVGWLAERSGLTHAIASSGLIILVLGLSLFSSRTFREI